ncbi:hypothetical protein HanIR_Chr08g0373601 [Helianthus annuus]|nr:hypothetical protein HanIR_Chr08g0373601 [Helianthus annuus]
MSKLKQDMLSVSSSPSPLPSPSPALLELKPSAFTTEEFEVPDSSTSRNDGVSSSLTKLRLRSSIF